MGTGGFRQIGVAASGRHVCPEAAALFASLISGGLVSLKTSRLLGVYFSQPNIPTSPPDGGLFFDGFSIRDLEEWWGGGGLRGKPP